MLFLSFFLFFSSTTSAFNITRLLGKHPEFSHFNDYLTQTQLYAEINNRRTITVLAVENRALSSLSGNSLDVIKKTLSLHVVLDYFDVEKLKELSNKTALLTTLFQSSGVATSQQGFLNVTDLITGEVAFGSAVKGSSLNAHLVKSVAAQPYNISVLQISTPIIAPGFGAIISPIPPSASPTEAPKNAAVEAPTPSEKTPPESPVNAPTVATPEPADTPIPPSDAPSDATVPADAPMSDAPLSSPPSVGAADEAPSPSPSSGTRVAIGLALLL
jgi:hypothetical protein